MIGCTFKNKEHFRNILNCFVGHLVTNVTQLVLVCSKSTAETQDQDLKSVQSYQWRQRNDIIWRRSRVFINWADFIPSSVSVVNFKQANVGCV